MVPVSDHRLRPRITIRHLAVLVAFAAVASAVVMPRARGSLTPQRFLAIVLVELPYPLLIPTLILVRRGAFKTWLLSFLCSVPLAWFAAWLMTETWSFVRHGWDHERINFVLLGFLLSCDSIVVGCPVVLTKWSVPRICPACRRPSLLRDSAIPHNDRSDRSSEPRSCVACGSRFRRERRGDWVDVATLPLRPPLAGRPSPILSTETPEHHPR